MLHKIKDSDGKNSEKENEGEATKKNNCFNCGDPSHLASNCHSKDPKCFKCNSWGHKSINCSLPQIRTIKEQTEDNSGESDDEKSEKEESDIE